MASALGIYAIHGRLARGGMAELFLASKLTSDGTPSLVAIKCLLPEVSADPMFRRMFQDEAMITSHLDHPNIAKLYDFGVINDRPYLVMEYIAGASLATLFKSGPLPPWVVAQVGAAVAEALHAAHVQTSNGKPLGIIHRDVTPHNVMISFDGRIKLLDFGIALARVRAERTRTGLMKGKWAYIAPEQILNMQIDCRTDIYSLGVTLFESLTGKRAFTGKTPSQILTKVLEDPLVFSEEHLKILPPGLCEVIVRCTNKKKKDRYLTAEETAKELWNVAKHIAEDTNDSFLGELVVKRLPKLYETVLETTDEVFGAIESEPSAPVAREFSSVLPVTFEIVTDDAYLDDTDIDAHPFQLSLGSQAETLDAGEQVSAKLLSTTEDSYSTLSVVMTILVAAVLGLGISIGFLIFGLFN